MPLGVVPAERIPQLAVLYDRFANTLDPFAPERDQAEMLFEQEVAGREGSLVLPLTKVSITTKMFRDEGVSKLRRS